MAISKLGIDGDSNSITVDQGERREGTYIIGAPGKGKSVLLHNLILQDITQGIGVIVVDPNRDLISNIIQTMPVSRLDDVILLDIQETDKVFGLNLYECANPTDAKAVQYTMDRVMRIWDRLFTIKRENPLMQNHLRNSAHLIIANPGYTLADIPLIYYDENLRKRLVANVKDMYVRLFWQNFENPVSKLDRSREVSAILNKFTEYVQPMIVNIIGQARSTVDFRWCMDNHKIVLLQLDQQLLATTQLIGGTLISLVLQAAFSRINIPLNKRRQCNVYIDELDYQATLDTQQLYQEGRKHGVTITAAHQSRTRLLNEVPELARGILGAATTVVFQITPPDSDELSGKFDTTPPEPPMEQQGTQAIRTPIRKPIDWLLSGKTHTNATINDFTSKWDMGKVKRKIEANGHTKSINEIAFLDALNSFCYDAMYYKDPNNILITSEFLSSYCMSLRENNLYARSLLTIQSMKISALITILKRTAIPIETAYHRLKLLTELDGVVSFTYRAPDPAGLAKHMAIFLNRAPYTANWLSVDFTTLQWETDTSYLVPNSLGANPIHYRLVKGQQSNWYTSQSLDAEINRVITTSTNSETQTLIHFLTDLLGVLNAFMTEPIEDVSGRQETIYKPGQRKTHAERQQEIENQLSGLPRLRARVKLASFPPQLHSKVCQICGKALPAMETICNVCKVPLQSEYVITVDRYNRPYADVKARRQAIIAKNVQDGFLRDRLVVEAEIAARQQLPPAPANVPPKTPPAASGTKANIPPAPVASPAAPTPRKRAINTPATKQCPSCKAQNTPAALFCNMCGAKI